MDVVVRNLIPMRGSRRSVAGELVAGLVEKSYVVLLDHEVDESLFEEAEKQARAFFARPLAERLSVDIRQSVAHRGYVPQSEAGDYEDEGIRRYEAFDVGRDLDPRHPLVAANTPLLGPNSWPAGNSVHDFAFKQATNTLYDALATQADRLLDLIEVGFDFRPGTFAQYRSEPLSQMRYINYFERPDVAGDHPGMGAHTDYEFITLLRPYGNGLQVKLRTGEWEAIDAPPGSLILLAGDLLETVTGGKVRSCLHRVPDIAGPRFSIPFFAGADYSALVCPAPGMGDGTRQEPVAAGPHLLRQMMRDFPYLRERHSLPDVIDLRDTAAAPQWTSAFEKRQLTG